MIEQQLEKKMMDSFAGTLSATSIQMIGAWQPTSGDKLKGIEESGAEGFLVVKVLPRNYETPTIPTAQFQCIVSLVMKAEVDADGATYLSTTDSVSNIMQGWQNNLESAIQALQIDDVLEITGFQLTGGDAGVDKNNKSWTYTQNMIVYGVVLSK